MGIKTAAKPSLRDLCEPLVLFVVMNSTTNDTKDFTTYTKIFSNNYQPFLTTLP